MKFKLFTTFVIVTIMSILVMSSAAQDEEIPQITITATADGLDVPAELPEGMVTITFDNQSEAPILPVPSRLLEDVTQEDFTNALVEGGQDAALALIAMQGGTFIFPETAVAVTYDLQPGDYALIDFALEEPVMVWFTVADGEGEGVAVELESDYEVHLMDFAFHMPLELEAGEHLWHIENTGGQWHEMAIMRIEDGMTLDDAREMLFAEPEEGAEAGEGEEGAMPDFLWIPMNEGEQAWLNITLEPGTYVVGCMLPNMDEIEAGEAPHMHAELGMLQVIVVE